MYTWQNGEVITAEKLNTLEGRIGFDVVDGSTTLTEEEITTTMEKDNMPFAMGFMEYSDFINADVLNVIFNGVEYSLEKKTHPNADGSFYGDMENNEIVFNNYPFAIYSGTSGNYNEFTTPSPGTYNIKITIPTKTIETTEDFEQAVKKSGLKNIKDGEGEGSIAEGAGTTASGPNSHAEGAGTTASGPNSHAEGAGTTASGNFSHAEGMNTKASEQHSHAEGVNTTASGLSSHAEGAGTKASRNQSHAEGANTEASGDQSHAEGAGTKASGSQSHAEGTNTEASGDQSHAEGAGTKAFGQFSHAEGAGTIANHKSQHVIGEYNIADPSTAASNQKGNYAFIIGNGISDNERLNALAMKWDGTLVLSDGTEVKQGQIKALLALLNT